ncbi:hypothetical protein AZE42_04248 [Rhizopogon vesiculosus]|uniref:Uncharacterized protein n=1 Tax=Rhizopogon vesiculosus TaxID=180088 RepID=A0A1J8PUB7_9AGAM|nr:hypothetical protein AZE42_04248 [Rhizopogon vesiculosus]
MLLCQCVVTLRVWYLFHQNPFIKWLAVTVFIASMAGTVIIGSVRFGDVKVAYEINTNDPSQSPPAVFTIYLPSLIVHTVMFSLTMYRFRVSSLQGHQIIHRFLKEGIFMYAFAAGAYLESSLSVDTKADDSNLTDITIYYSALGGGIAVGTTVVSVCRAMLSIRSLAATYHVDPSWLLSHAELSRVQWRRGGADGEIYVEVNELDVVLPTTSLKEEGGVQKCT